MIIHFLQDAKPQEKELVLQRITALGFKYDLSHGSTGIELVGVLGDVSKIEESVFLELNGVDKVIRISRPYKLVSREYSKATRTIQVGKSIVGGNDLVIMAGPCSVESREQMFAIGEYVSAQGISIMRGGAYKPRTSPYSFQGMGRPGLDIMAEVRAKYGLSLITEASGLHRHLLEDGSYEERNVLENVLEVTDIVQVGARNMKSFGFLQELGRLTAQSKLPILLKRGESSTLKDFLLAAEYIVANGNPNVMLCLRGIRTFEEEKFQRYTPDIGAITVLKRESNLPVLFDPSHATGYRNNVYGVAMAAVAAGADGLIIETHNDPSRAKCDGEQSVTAPQLAAIKRDGERIRKTILEAQSS